MASLDASPMNIILTVAVSGLVGFFIVLLIKLNPSVETKRKEEVKDRAERPRQLEPSSQPIVQPAPPQPQPPAKIEPPMTTPKPLLIVNSVSGNSNTHTSCETATQTSNHVQPVSLPNRTPSPAGNMFTQARRDCIHHFGYLRAFPKNSPIPDECFGCEKIVDCLVSKKSGRK
jgi:hypothetical protein